MSDRIIEEYKINNLNIEIWQDWDCESPADWGNFTIVQFRDNNYTTYKQLEYSEFVTENDCF